MLKPSIYILDYRPINDTLDTGYGTRSYEKAWSFENRDGFAGVETKDLLFTESALYKSISETEFALVFKDGEWKEKAKAKAFLAKLAKELGYTVFPYFPEMNGKKKVMQKRLFECKKSVGYFLKGKSYEVYSLVVGKVLPLSGYEKKIIFLDYETGIPGVLDVTFGTDFKKIE
ncbi:MAG: hypothetical protein LBL47_01270 [Lactobacillus sp.]|nr:hypothetical protein [Lactobacillus sp.]